MTHDASDAGLHSCGRLNERSTYHHATTTRHVVSEVSFLFKIIIGSKSLYCKYSTAQKTVFTRSAIGLTSPKVNRFG